MKKLILFRIAVFALTISGFASIVAGATATIDVNTKYQKIEGFGASTAWGSSMSTTDADLLWSTTTGAGLSLHRIRIDYTSGSTSELNIAKLAVARGVTVWASPWTPPAAYKSNNKSVMGNLTNPSAYATYLVDFVNKMKSSGVPIYAVSAQNEPDANVTYESCVFTPAQMATWVGKSMGPALSAIGVKVMGPESQNWYGIANFWPTLKADADFMKYIDIVATHEYGGTVKAYPDILQAGKQFWETEIYDMNGTADVGMGSALRVAKLIHEAMTIASMSAWHYWWVYPSTTDNGALWDKASNKPSKRLWVMGNYSRFVRPGYVRIDATVAPVSGVSLSAYYSAKDNRVVIVAINNNTSSTSQTFTLSHATGTKVTPWVTDGSNNIVEKSSLTPSANSFTYSLPAQSVTSLVIDLEGTSVLNKTMTTQLSAVKVNCNKSTLKIDLTAPASGLTSMKLFDLNGNIVKTAAFQTSSGKLYSHNFDITDLHGGFYLVKIENDGNTIQKSKILLTK